MLKGFPREGESECQVDLLPGFQGMKMHHFFRTCWRESLVLHIDHPTHPYILNVGHPL